jgi:hypothetical protein
MKTIGASRPAELRRRRVLRVLAGLCAALAVSGALVPVPSASATAAPAVQPVSRWQRVFDAGSSTYLAQNLRLSRSSDSWDYYNLAYAIDAYASMYEATGRSTYAAQALQLVTGMVDRSRPSSSLPGRWHDSFRGWVSQRADVRGQQVPLFESYAWRYVTRLLRIIRQSPALWRNATYRAQYDSLLAFSERDIFEKWYSRGAAANIYRNRTHMAAHWAYISLDLSVLTRNPARRSLYDKVFTNINRHMPNGGSSLRRQLSTSRAVPTAYVWSDQWNAGPGRPQDVDHANGVLSYVVEAREVGREWTATDIARFTDTFTKLVWPKSGVPRQYVDGSGSGSGWFADGFVKLGRYSAPLQRRLEAHTRGRSLQYIAALALNARRLSR